MEPPDSPIAIYIADGHFDDDASQDFKLLHSLTVTPSGCVKTALPKLLWSIGLLM